MRIDLKVPFAEKDEAKALGARWDAARKVWYALNPADPAVFARWLSVSSAAGGQISTPRPARSSPAAAAQGFTVGSNYVERPRVCDCLPWESCAKCEAVM